MTQFEEFAKKQYPFLCDRDQALAAEAIKTWFYPAKPSTDYSGPSGSTLIHVPEIFNVSVGFNYSFKPSYYLSTKYKSFSFLFVNLVIFKGIIL